MLTAGLGGALQLHALASRRHVSSSAVTNELGDALVGDAQQSSGVPNRQAFLHQTPGSIVGELRSRVLRTGRIESGLCCPVDHGAHSGGYLGRHDDREGGRCNVQHPCNRFTGHLLGLVDATDLGMGAGDALYIQRPPVTNAPPAYGIALH
jgi:hypothetical protein